MTNANHADAAALRGCLEVCRRCDALVGAVTAARGESTEQVFGLLGPHLRHCLDHFTSLLRGLPAGDIDYDARDRDASIEREPQQFRSALAEAVSGLQKISVGELQRPLRIRQQPAPDTDPRTVDSTLERELVFLSSHTIHHLALMVHVAGSHGLELPEDLGVAFSTASYRESAASPST